MSGSPKEETIIEGGILTTGHCPIQEKCMGRNLYEEFKKSKLFEPFDKYKVKIHLKNIVGGIPKSKEMIDCWLKTANKNWTDEQREAIKNATIESLPDAGEALTDKQTVCFKRDPEKGLYIDGRIIKAMLKENCNVIKDLLPNPAKKGNEKGITNLKSKAAEQLFVDEEKVYLGRMEPDYVDENPIHVMTAQGPRDSIKRFQLVFDADIEFTLWRRIGNIVPEFAMLAALDYAQTLGLGASRSQGYGQFNVISVEKIEDEKDSATRAD